MIKIGIITISDSASAGHREDRSGAVIVEMIKKIKAKVTAYQIVPDKKELIIDKLRYLGKSIDVDVILTTGGTGLSDRDVTPEATKAVIEKEIPGITELMRNQGAQTTPTAVLSRAVAGVYNKTLIINLPGSVKGVEESLGAIMNVISHAVDVLQTRVVKCGG